MKNLDIDMILNEMLKEVDRTENLLYLRNVLEKNKAKNIDKKGK